MIQTMRGFALQKAVSGLNFSDSLERLCVCEKGLALGWDSRAFPWGKLFWEGMTKRAEPWSWSFNFLSVEGGQKEPPVLC